MRAKITAVPFILLLFCFTVHIQGQSLMPDPELSLIEVKENRLEKFLSRYVQFNSVSGNEKKAGEWLQGICRESGFHIKQMGDTDSNYNFSASIYPLTSGLPNIVFLNHIDVVPPGDLSKWKHPPFSGKITNTEIWGRGTFDNKGTAIMQLFSIAEVMKKHEDEQLPYNVTFLAVSCEETECDGGAEYVIENHLDELNPEIIIGEGPPALNGIINTNPEQSIFPISIAHKRALWIELKLKINTSAHGSVTPDKYANKEMVKALDHLLDKKQKVIFNDLNVNLLKSLGKLEKGLTGFALKHPKLFKMLITPKLRERPELFALFSNTITLTSLESDNKVVNVIPSEVRALLDCRLLPDASEEEFLKDLKKRLKNNNIEISILHSLPKMKSSDDKSPFYKHLKKAIEKNYPETEVITIFLPNSSDVGLFRAKGISSYTSVPLNIPMEYLDNIHSENERIPRHVLDKGKDTYVDFIEECVKGAPAPLLNDQEEEESLSALDIQLPQGKPARH